MADTIYKTFRAELKEPDEDGSLNMFIPVSTMSMDRDGEVIEPSAFKKTIPKFMNHPVLVASHDYRDLTNQIGEWTKLKITDKGIEGKPKYYVGMGNEQADWAYKLAQKGVAAFSIGFIPTKWEDGDGIKSARRTYQEVELLEISQVIIPSNRDAIMGMRSKGVDPIVNSLLDEVEKSDLITKPEETMNMIRMPVPSEAGKHDGHKIRTIDISTKEGIKALYCVTDKVIMTYLFDKEKWDMEKVRQWMQAHMGKGVVRDISQEEIADEIDYLKSILSSGINETTRKALQGLIKSTWGELVKMDMAEMQKMYEMMGECEDMCGECKGMCESMIVAPCQPKTVRESGNDIPVKDINTDDILESLKRIGGK